MSAKTFQFALSTTDWHLDFAYGFPSSLLECDPDVDDPVNDTGVGPRLGDLRLAEETACPLSVVFQGIGESL